MPLFEVAVFKRLNTGTDLKRWSNVYHVEATTLEDALDGGQAIAVIEADVHKDYVIFSYVTAREAVEDPPPGGRRELTLLGQITGDETLRLPGFNTVRVLLNDGNGRPSQKYLRLPLEEGDIVEGTINVTINNLLNLDYVSPLIAFGALRSNSGDPITAGSVVPAIQMRQSNWNRRTRVGFKRGWVPV